jgi:hypothetical protein
MTTDRRRRPKPAQDSRVVATGLAGFALFALVTGMAWGRPPASTTPGTARTSISADAPTGGSAGSVVSTGAGPSAPAPPPTTSGGS